MTAQGAGRTRLAILVGLKMAAGFWALHQGFTHVSDDDYARVVIAEQFAHTPRWDPSGTSWLPFPFWLTGEFLRLGGRSLGAAMALAWLSGLASVALGYAGMRAARIPSTPAFLATALVAVSPENVWLGVATVPEALTAALVFFGAMTLGGQRWPLLGGAAVLFATLSRYEAWPVAGVFVVCSIVAAWRRPATHRRRLLGGGALAAAGPIAWMLWNRAAHGSLIHFFVRVAAFHDAHAAARSPIEALLLYPKALAEAAPELLVLGLVGAAGLATTSAETTDAATEWAGPLLCGAAVIGFLAYGEIRGGAPTHHPERATLFLFWLLAAMGAEGSRRLVRVHAWARTKREAWAVALGVAGGVAVLGQDLARLSRPPGESPSERRTSQVARGLELRGEGISALTVEPCAYEHFALIAAFGAPERVTVLPATERAVTSACPAVRLP